MKLPKDTGYSVNRDTSTVHSRYPGDHAGEVQRTRTSKGVDTLLDGRKGKVCRTCYPVSNKDAPDVKAPPSGQARRVDTAEPDGQ